MVGRPCAAAIEPHPASPCSAPAAPLQRLASAIPQMDAPLFLRCALLLLLLLLLLPGQFRCATFPRETGRWRTWRNAHCALTARMSTSGSMHACFPHGKYLRAAAAVPIAQQLVPLRLRVKGNRGAAPWSTHHRDSPEDLAQQRPQLDCHSQSSRLPMGPSCVRMRMIPHPQRRRRIA